MFFLFITYLMSIIFPYSTATAIPQQTIFTSPSRTFSNTARNSAPGAATMTGCPTNCCRDTWMGYFVYWSPLSVTTTITAETVLHVVNHVSNITRTTTITNPEVDLSNSTAITNTNSAGTQTTTIIVSDSQISTLVYPTAWYPEYPASQAVWGTLSTTVNGTATCMDKNASNAVTFAYPSQLPQPVPIVSLATNDPDPKGLLYVASIAETEDISDIYGPLWPHLGLWNCKICPDPSSPDEALSTALYLTVTSTSTEPGKGTFAPSYDKPSLSIYEEATSIHELQPSGFAMGRSSSYGSSISTSGAVALAAPSAGTKTSSEAFPKHVTGLLDISEVPGPESLPTQPISTHVPPSHSLVASDGISVMMEGAAKSSADVLVRPTNEQEGAAPSTTKLAAVGASAATTNTIKGSTTLTNGASPFVFNSQITSVDVIMHYPIPGQTLHAGSSLMLSSGAAATPTFLYTSGSQTTLIVGSSTFNLFASLIASTALTTGSPSATAESHDQYIVQGQTLVPGVPIILNSGPSATLSDLRFNTSNNGLVAGSITSTTFAAATGAQPITIGNQIVSADTQIEYILGGQTLTPGGRITISGTVISLASSATQVVVETSTQGFDGHSEGGLAGGGPRANGTESVAAKGPGARSISSWASTFSVIVVTVVLAVLM